ncbi:MAG: T9SS type A sorting domain-containing protein [Flavobacteriaceae bacterium]|nr:T9SS type A sorting domain-containing protein [Flavobacteriaceae bacterium]
MKKLLLSLTVLFTINCFSQITNEGKPQSWKKLDNSQNIQAKLLPGFDLKTVQDEDKVNDGLFDRPWRFGFMHSVDFGFEQGQWDTLDNGDRIWRILISSPGALSLNVIFDDFFIPEGSTVYLYNNERTDLLGAYTSVQNQESGILGTWLVKGDSLWIEYFEPANVSGQGRLHIAKATHGYRNAETFKLAKGLNDSGDCNLDVDCSIGSDWVALKDLNKRSAGILLSGGSGFCSGALVNNTANDGKPYFLTADHCFSDPNAWAFRFGWISPNPVCATTANSTDGPTNLTISGATLRARSAASDFCLVEINSPIPSAWDRVWAGWDKTDNFPTFQVGIHHPSGDIMKVCRDDDPATKEVNAGAQTWEILGGAGGGWELGVTEPGSSGSPLFDQNGRVIGQLFGGAAACSGTNDNGALDYYGRFGVSWDNGATPATRLKEWLDPSGSNPDFIDSYPPLTTYALDGAVGINIPSVSCGNTEVNPTITLINFGTGNITNATIEWNIDGGTNTTINFSGNLAQNESEIFNIGPIAVSSGTLVINASLTDVNGGTDENTANDNASNSVDIPESYETTQVHLELLTDDYAEETSWQFRDSSGAVLYSFGPYEATTDDNTIFNYSFDVVENECYFFEIFDVYSDGICCSYGNGYYTLTTDNSTVIFTGGEFSGDGEITEIGIEGELGVSDNLAQNIIMFPNPANNLFNIQITDGNEDLDYTIINILGQVVKKGALNNGVNTITTANFNSGLYFVKVQDIATNKSVVNKLIIK